MNDEIPGNPGDFIFYSFDPNLRSENLISYFVITFTFFSIPTPYEMRKLRAF